MSFGKAEEYLKRKNYAERIITFDVSSATVELAAAALNCEPALIAKSLTFKVNDNPVMIICTGDVKIDNAKYKAKFSTKAVMLSPDEVDRMIGHSIGGVCPFGINEGVSVWLDESLKRFEIIYPACGDAASAVRLTPDELFELSGADGWVDVTKPR